jgi:hypothetical protein
MADKNYDRSILEMMEAIKEMKESEINRLIRKNILKELTDKEINEINQTFAVLFGKLEATNLMIRFLREKQVSARASFINAK